MKRFWASAYLYLALCTPLLAQTFSEFYRTWEGGDVEYGYGLRQDRDGGFVLAGNVGWVNPTLRSEACLLKVDISGSQLWNLTYGGSNAEAGRDLTLTDDGGYLLVGSTSSFGMGSTDFFIVKTDGNGSVQWARAVGGSGADVALSAAQTTDGGYIVGGYTYSFGQGNGDYYAVKLDAAGNLQWTRVVGGAGTDISYNIAQSPDGGYIMGGYTRSFGSGIGNFYLVKLDAAGALQWNRVYGGSSTDLGYRAWPTSDGGYIAAGYTTSFGAGSTDFLVIKTDPTGLLQWTRSIGGAAMDRAYNVLETYDGGFVLTGETSSATFGAGDQMIVKISPIGNLLWAYHYGSNVDETGFGLSVETSDRGIALSGWDDGNEDILLFKTDSLGDPKCNRGNLSPLVTTPTLSQTSGGITTTGGTLNNLAITANPFPLTEITRCFSVLDGEEINFTGQSRNGYHDIQWQGPQDRGNWYVLEKSMEGKHFEEIHACECSGFKREDPGIDTWYRLRIWDATGQQSTSKVLFLKGNSQKSPLTITRTGTTSWQLSQGKAKVQLLDFRGKVIRDFGSVSSASILSTEGIPAGVYMFTLKENADRQVQKVAIP